MTFQPVSLALFGAGRAGHIHFLNIVSSPRTKLLYILDIDIKKASDLVEKYGLNAKVLHPKNADQVYKDPR